MNAKRSTQTAQWIVAEEASASPRVPAGAVLASELVLHRLAFEALALSIARTPRTVCESVDEDGASR